MKDPTIPVFDFGGVLIDWNPRHLFRQLFRGDDAKMEYFLSHICSPEWNLMQDAGRSFAEATAALSARYPEYETLIMAYHQRWEEMIAGAIMDTVTLLYALKQRGLPLYGITNWSAETFALTRRRFEFFELFDGMIISGEVRLLKPNPEIFHCFLNTYGLAADECLFIDDSIKNVDGAKAVGMDAVHFESPPQLARVLRAKRLL